MLKVHFFILRIKGETSELTFYPVLQYDNPEVFYGDSKEIVQILDMTINESQNTVTFRLVEYKSFIYIFC